MSAQRNSSKLLGERCALATICRNLQHSNSQTQQRKQRKHSIQTPVCCPPCLQHHAGHGAPKENFARVSPARDRLQTFLSRLPKDPKYAIVPGDTLRDYIEDPHGVVFPSQHETKTQHTGSHLTKLKIHMIVPFYQLRTDTRSRSAK